MHSASNHIVRLVNHIALMVVLVASVIVARADNAKRSAAETSRDGVRKSSFRYLTPLDGAIRTVGTVVATRPSGSAKVQSKTAFGADTVRKENRIIFARASADVFTARVELGTDETAIEVGIYNMLGKKVMDVYRGAAARGLHDYTVGIPELPEGIYICIMQGSDFRKAEKFYHNR